MNISAVHTPPVIPGTDLLACIDTAIPTLQERTVIVITSKIVSICEGSVVPTNTTTSKIELAKTIAERFTQNDELAKRYHGMLTIHKNNLIFNAGIDESNGNSSYILWPRDPQQSAVRIWEHLRQKHALHELGVIISDSHTTPLRWGTSGFGLAWCGFDALKSYIGKPDIFGRPLQYTNLSIVDGLAASAVVVMGEGNEQTPIATITDIPFVQFRDTAPTQQELEALQIALEDDMYAPLLTSVTWNTQKKS